MSKIVELFPALQKRELPNKADNLLVEAQSFLDEHGISIPKNLQGSFNGWIKQILPQAFEGENSAQISQSIVKNGNIHVSSIAKEGASYDQIIEAEDFFLKGIIAFIQSKTQSVYPQLVTA